MFQSPVHVHGEEVDVVVLSVKRILVVRTVEGVVIDAAQHQTFRQGAEERVLVRAQPGARGNGVDLAFDGPHRILDSALLESLDVRQLHGRIQGGLLCKQGGIDDVDLVIGFGPASHERKRVLLRPSRILTSTPLIKNLFYRNKSTWGRSIKSMARLRTMFDRRATNHALAAAT